MSAPAGWDEGEAMEFSKALKQPMVLQTPLQVILEALFSRIQAQATLFTEVLKRIDHVEAREVPQQELMHRIRRCEDGLSAINHEKLSPFHQQDILTRIEALEAQAATFAPLPEKSSEEAVTQTRGAATPLLSHHQGIDSPLRPGSTQGGQDGTNRISPLPGVVTNSSRLDALEQKLAGVYNLGGKLIAVEQMAAEMDIDIPDMECTLSLEEQQELRQKALPAGTSSDQGAPSTAGAAGAGEAGQGGGPGDAGQPAHSSREGSKKDKSESQEDSPAGPSREGSRGNTTARSDGQQRQPSQQGSRGGACPPGGQDGRAGTADGAAESSGQGPHHQQLPLQDLSNRAVTPRSGGGVEGLSRSATMTPRVNRQQTEQQLNELGSKVSALQADNQELHRLLDEVTRAHQDLESIVQGSSAANKEHLQSVEAKMGDLQEAMNADLIAVAKEVRKPPEVSYADLQALTARVDNTAAELGRVGNSTHQIKTKDLVLLHEQMADVLEQVKKAGQTRDMDTLFHNRLSQLEESLGSVKTEVQLAVADVLEDIVKVSDLQALEAQLDERASQEDLRQVAQQQANLAQSVSQVANWMASRPQNEEASNKGILPAGFKLRCLTCDQEVKAPPGSGTRSSEGSLRPKTNFLPKLDTPHTPNHVHPLGPGLNAAEMRRLAEERTAGGSKRGSPLRSSEVEDYGAERSTASPGMGRSTRTQLPANTLNSVVTKTPNRSPVFI